MDIFNWRPKIKYYKNTKQSPLSITKNWKAGSLNLTEVMEISLHYFFSPLLIDHPYQTWCSFQMVQVCMCCILQFWLLFEMPITRRIYIYIYVFDVLCGIGIRSFSVF